MQNKSLQMQYNNASRAEASYLTVYILLDRLTNYIQAGGIFSLFLLPLFDTFKAGIFWFISKDIEDKSLRNSERGIHLVKAAASIAGISIAVLTGGIMLGFGIIIAMSFFMATKSLATSVIALYNRNFSKAAEQSFFAITGGAIATGFMFMTFIPGLNLIGWGLALAGAGILALKGLADVVISMFSNKKPTYIKVPSNSSATSSPKPNASPDTKDTVEYDTTHHQSISATGAPVLVQGFLTPQQQQANPQPLEDHGVHTRTRALSAPGLG